MKRNKRQKPPPVETLVSNLPCEIIHDILIRLPSKSLLRFKCVCKSWNALISYPQFIQSHHNHSQTSNYRGKIFYQHPLKLSFVEVYPRGEEETQVEELNFPVIRNSLLLCSCDGLLLLQENKPFPARDIYFYLWNPSVRKYAKFSYPSHFTSYAYKIGYGLCYDSSTCDYKFLVMHKNRYFTYSVAKNSWRKSKNFPYSVTKLDCSVFVNGSRYWVVKYLTCNAGNDVELRRGDIICFNPREKNFSMFHRPEPEFVDEHYRFCLTVLEGCLGFYCHSTEKKMIEIWLRRTGRDYNETSSWEKMMIISDIPEPRYAPVSIVCYLRESELLLCIKGRLFLYDVKERKFLEVNLKSIACFYDWKERKFLEVNLKSIACYTVAVQYVDSLLLPGVWATPKRRWLKTEKHELTSTKRIYVFFC